MDLLVSFSFDLSIKSLMPSIKKCWVTNKKIVIIVSIILRHTKRQQIIQALLKKRNDENTNSMNLLLVNTHDFYRWIYNK